MTQRASNQENSLPTSNDQTLSERLRDCVKVTFSAGLHGVESDCRQAAEELDRQRAEIERLTRELKIKTEACEFHRNRAQQEATERDRLRAALETVLDEVCWPDTPAFKAARKAARKLLSGEPSSDETKEDDGDEPAQQHSDKPTT